MPTGLILVHALVPTYQLPTYGLNSTQGRWSPVYTKGKIHIGERANSDSKLPPEGKLPGQLQPSPEQPVLKTEVSGRTAHSKKP